MRRPDLRGNWKRYLFWGVIIVVAALVLWRVASELTNIIDGVWSAVVKLFNALLPVGWAMVIAYLLRPLAAFLERVVFAKLKISKGLSTLVIALLILGVAFSLSYWMLPMFIQSATEAIARLPGLIEPLIASSTYGALIGEVWAQAQTFLSQSVTISAQTLIATAGQIAQWLMTTVIALYILHQRKTLRKGFQNVLEPWLGEGRYRRFEALMQKLDRVFGGYFIGKLLESAAIILLCTAGFYIAGVPYAPLFAILVGVGSLVPYIGPLVAAAPAVLVTFLDSSQKLLPLGIVLAVVFLADGYFIGPKLIGGRLGLSALGVIVGVTVGGGIAGLWGMILGIPAVSVIRMAVLSLTYWRKNKLREKRSDDDEGLNLSDEIHK